MENVHMLTAGHAWQAGALVAVLVAGIGVRRYGRMLERQTRERSERRPL